MCLGLEQAMRLGKLLGIVTMGAPIDMLPSREKRAAPGLHIVKNKDRHPIWMPQKWVIQECPDRKE